MVPSARLSLLPLRKIRDIVPWVEGVHLSANAWPPFADRPPGGTIKALGFDCAKAIRGALRRASNAETVIYMVVDVIVYLCVKQSKRRVSVVERNGIVSLPRKGR